MPSGTLLLTIDQVDRTADGDRRARLARAPPRRRVHVHRCCGAGRARRGGALSAPLVVGVDVGSQGTCAQALEPDGTLVATAYAAARAVLSAAGLGGAGPGGVDSARSSRRSPRVARGDRGARDRRALVRLAARRAWWRRDADGEPLRPALIWSDRRAGEECAAVAARVGRGAAARADRLQPRPGHVGAEDRVAGGARAGRVRRGARVFALPGSWVAWRVTGELAVDPSNGSSTGLLDPRTRGVGGRGVRRRASVDVGAAAARGARRRRARAGAAVAVRGDRAVRGDARW